MPLTLISEQVLELLKDYGIKYYQDEKLNSILKSISLEHETLDIDYEKFNK